MDDLIEKLNAITLSTTDYDTDDLETDEDDLADFNEQEATYCPSCEGVFEFGEDGYLGIACPDCGSTSIHEILWCSAADILSAQDR